MLCVQTEELFSVCVCLCRVLAYVCLCKHTRLLQCISSQIKRLQPNSLVKGDIFSFQWCKMDAGKCRQKKLICEHSSNEVSIATAFVWTPTMVRVIWIPLRRAKWPPIVRGEHTGSEASLSPQCGQSNYDIIFLQGFSESSHFTQRGWDWTGVKQRKLSCWRVSGSLKPPSGNFLAILHFAFEWSLCSSCIMILILTLKVIFD